MPASQTKQSAEADLPIYTNFRYPFPGRFSNLSTYVPTFKNPTGVFRALLNLPEKWQEDRENNDLILLLHGAGPGVEVFVNGKRLGYHTDSMTEHEYLIPTECVPEDGNKDILLCLRIFKYCSGSYMEDQDQWWLTGIHRNVELQLRPKTAIWDMDIRASYAAARVEISCELVFDEVSMKETEKDKRYFVRATLFESSSSPLETLLLPCQILPKSSSSKMQHRKQPVNFEMNWDDDEKRFCGIARGSMFVLPKERIEPWTAESPRLYSLVLELVKSANENEQEFVSQVEIVRVGFRDIRMNPEKFGQFEINNERIVFRGVNRHEFSPHRGKVLTEESMIADILQMKRFNFNAVRNCHYPNNHRWYELCDYYGLYVLDEANIETHGFVLGGAISLIQFDERFLDSFLYRCQSMVYRSRLHPSVICWSLGNESGFGPNSYECSRLIRALDDERPVVYEGGSKAGVPLLFGDGRNPVSDFIIPMYHSPSVIYSYKQESMERFAPVVLCEYGHCMGNSGGNLHEYWDLFWRNSVWQGGFIWDWVDQGIAFSPPSIPTSQSLSSVPSSSNLNPSHISSTSN